MSEAQDNELILDRHYGDQRADQWGRKTGTIGGHTTKQLVVMRLS